MERVTEVVTVVQRIDIVHVEQPGLSSLILIVRSRVLLGLEPQSLAQGLPVFLSVVFQHLADSEGSTIDKIASQLCHLFPFGRGNTWFGLIHQHFHQEGRGSSFGCLAHLSICITYRQHYHCLPQVFLNVGVGLFFCTSGYDKLVNCFCLRSDRNTTVGLHKVEVEECAQKFGLAIDTLYLLVSIIGVGRHLYAVDVCDDLVGAMYTDIVDFPTLTNPDVRGVETEHHELPHF